MQSESTQPAMIYKIWEWVENHKKQTIQGAAAVIVVGAIISYFIWNQSQREETAGRELSKVMLTRAATPDDFLKFAAQYSGTSAGGNALLQAAQMLFTVGNYPEAQTQFQKFRQDYRTSPLVGTAALGIAACLDAQGKADEAMAAYQDLIQRHQSDMIVIQSQFALARLLESKNQIDQAEALYDAVAQEDGTGTFGAEAGIRAHELRAAHPVVAKAAAPAVPTANLPATTPK